MLDEPKSDKDTGLEYPGIFEIEESVGIFRKEISSFIIKPSQLGQCEICMDYTRKP